MDVREKYIMQKVNRKEKSICPNCIHHNLCIAENNQPCFECNRFIDANGVTVQSGIDANTFQLMRECERLKKEKESLANAVNVLEEINSDLYKQIKGVTVQEHGHWVSLTDCSNAGVYCSVCHKKVYKEDYAWCNRKNKLRSDYCPHCGAKMMSQPPKGE